MEYTYKFITVAEWKDIEPLLMELHRYHHERWPNVYSASTELKKEGYADYFGVACYHEQRMIGLCWGYFNTIGRANKVVWIEDFIVSPAYQANGIGGELMKMFEHQARYQGAEAIELHTVAENAHAVGIYRGYDFHILGLHMRKDL